MCKTKEITQPEIPSGGAVVSRWRDVKDELPKMETFVIATDGKKVRTVYHYGYDEIGNKYGTPQFSNKEHYLKEITHWMPLPEPPSC